MRAYRSTDNSYHTWRAGNYDPTMSDAVGDQAPPHPIVQYSDFVVVGTLGGPLARTDAESFPLVGLGTVGVPITLPMVSTPETAPGTDCRDYQSISVWFIVTAAPSPAVVTMQSLWTNTSLAATAAEGGLLTSDDAILAGVSPQNPYQAEYTVTGTTAATGTALGPFNVPVRGRNHRLVIRSDTGDVEGYAVALRIA
jgi:hypothetical protein